MKKIANINIYVIVYKDLLLKHYNIAMEGFMRANNYLMIVKDDGESRVEIKCNLSSSKIFSIYRLYQTIDSEGDIRGYGYVSAKYIIYKIDVGEIGEKMYPRIHIKPISELEHSIGDFDPSILIIGTDLNNQIKIDGIDDISRVQSRVNIFFNIGNKLNGCYRILSIDVVKYNDKVYPRIYTNKIGAFVFGVKHLDLSQTEPVGFGA